MSSELSALRTLIVEGAAHVWILGGDGPAFAKSGQPLALGGPVWRIELVSPGWPRPGAASAAR
jgi:hypothetical protein